MALTTHGRLLLAANNAEDPPFATLMVANGNAAKSHVSIITKIFVSNAIVPTGAGLSLEQPSWDPGTKVVTAAVDLSGTQQVNVDTHAIELDFGANVL